MAVRTANIRHSKAVAVRTPKMLWNANLTFPRTRSELKLYVGKQGKQDPAVIDVFQALPRHQRRRPAADDDVLTQRRPILEAHAEIRSDTVTDRTLEQQQLQRFGAIKTQTIRVYEST